MKKFFTVLFICVTALNMSLISIQANGEDEAIELSLNEAIEYALENSPLVSMSDTKIAAEKVNVAEQTRGYNVSDKPYIPFGTPDPLNSALGALKVSKGYYKSYAEMNLLFAEKGREQTVETIKFIVENKYFNVINARERLLIQKGILEYTEKNLNNINKKNELGMASELEVMGFETSHLKEQTEFRKLVREYGLSLIEFNKSIGLPLDAEVNLIDTIGVKALDEVDINLKINDALENRLEVFSAKKLLELNEFDFKITSSLFAQNTFKHQQAKYKVEEAQHQLNEIKQNIELMVRGAYIGMVNAYESISVVQKVVEQSEKIYEVTTMRYELGMATDNDVVDALNKLREAKLLEAQSILGYNLAVKQFEASYGIGVTVM